MLIFLLSAKDMQTKNLKYLKKARSVPEKGGDVLPKTCGRFPKLAEGQGRNCRFIKKEKISPAVGLRIRNLCTFADLKITFSLNMINRVLIRLKIVQIIYAYYQNGGKNLDTAEKELFFSLSKAYDLYNYLLLLMVEVTRYAAKRIDAAKHKVIPTKEDLCPNMKFVENRFIAQLEANKQLNEFVSSQKKTWDNEPDFIKSFCEQIMQSDIYKEYMAAETSSYAEDRELWRKLYKKFVFNNAALDDVLEDQSLYWNDDKEIVDTFVLKTIKRFAPENGENQELLPEFKDEEDQDFARRLFRRTILNADYYRHLISENSKNWDLSRVAVMDVVVMQIALAEILSFPNIPINVSLNEYVEIAKLYSTPKSGGFINGTLDGIVKRLKKENKLIKN